MTRSRFKNAIIKPSSTSRRLSIFSSLCLDRLNKTLRRWSKNALSTSFKLQTLGVTPSIKTFMLRENRISKSEFLNNKPIKTSASIFFDFGSKISLISSALSSLTSANIGIFFVCINSANFSINLDFCT